MSDLVPLNLFDYERLALERLPRMAADYFAGGAHDEVSLRENRAAFDRIALRYRVLAGTGDCDPAVELVGRHHPWPILIAPTAFARLAHDAGELAIARAARAADVTYTLSTLATASLEQVASVSEAAPRWFQLYIFRDRGVTRSLVQRAEAAGYEAIVLTVDAPRLGRRERDARNRFSLPPGIAPENLDDPAMRRIRSDDPRASGLLEYFIELVDSGLTWTDLDWLCSSTRLPILIKGVVRGDDAARAVEHGAAALIVSNHGGRQLDTSIPSIAALPDVARAVDRRVPLLLDGGVRRGTDVVKAIARGASGVLIGRPVLWGLAVNGEDGVLDVLRILQSEFALAMTLSGARSIAELTPDLLAG